MGGGFLETTLHCHRGYGAWRLSLNLTFHYTGDDKIAGASQALPTAPGAAPGLYLTS